MKSDMSRVPEEGWDFVVVGSGFGGSVSALRLVEKGYRVLLLEKGRRLGAGDFPKTNWDLRRWMWMPWFGFRGLFKMTFFRHVTVLSGVGVGGGSLVYANTLPIPERGFFEAPSWSHLADWHGELAPHYRTARQMLGATENPLRGVPDDILAEVARETGRPHTPTTVAVFFGKPGVTVADPYFGGRGPARTGCTACGGCMLGCRVGAKNTLDKNYLFLAERQGLTLLPDAEVTWVRPDAAGGYEITVKRGASLWGRRSVRVRTRSVIFAGGVLGTVPLLLRLREDPDGLPALSERLGHFVRTNSESLIGVVTPDARRDLSRGIAISSIMHTDAHSSLEPVRYPAGSGFFRILGVPHVRGKSLPERLARLVGAAVRHPLRLLRVLLVRDWAKQTLILLYMRALEGHLRMRLGRSLTTAFALGPVTTVEEGAAPTASIPEATALAERVADKLGGIPMSIVNETLLDIPTTAHILGGCTMGDNDAEGVIDAQHRVFNYDGLYVIDGSAISANPGVNPSLTITALAERAMTFIPPKA
jgi:cholesterol oxidase